MARNYQRLWEGVNKTTNEGQAIRALADILADKEGRTFLLRLERKDAELCIEILDHGIAEGNLSGAEKNNFFIVLRRLAGLHGWLPRSMVITEKIDTSDQILASGGFADVRTGTYMNYLVAVKTIRVAATDDFLKIRKQFCKEVTLWNSLSHPNVLKLTGVQLGGADGPFVTVSEWMKHGNIMEFIKSNHVNRLELLHGAAQGLKYLHDVKLVHGDLKGANILMTNDSPPRACLADFGFMTMVLDPQKPMSCSVQLEGGTTAFMAPELLMPSIFGSTTSGPTSEADIYAFGVVVFQVLTGEVPFPSLRIAELGYAVVEGRRPQKPEDALAIGFSDPLWDFMQLCWGRERTQRPGVATLVEQLGRAAAAWRGLMPPCTRGVENVASVSQEEQSGSLDYLAIFQNPTSTVVPASPASESQTSDGLFSIRSSASTQCTEPPSEEVRVAVPKPPAPVQPQSDDHEDVYPRQFESPPSNIPTKKRSGFRFFFTKLFSSRRRR